MSKAFDLIRRFSEDIDITVFREDLGESVSMDELERLSGKKRQAQLDQIRAACQHYVTDALHPSLLTQLADTFRASGAEVVVDDLDPDRQTILVRYPSALTPDPYVRPVVRIECGAKSALDPNGAFSLRPYISPDVPDLDLTVDSVTTILAERTFWDKIIIVHGLRAWFEKRGELRQQGQRVSRHYYDLHAILPTAIGDRALADLGLGRECVRHAAMFFGRPDFDLATAAAGHFALMPSEQMIDGLRRDYRAMAGMILGTIPSFDDVLTSITMLESRLRRPSR